MSQEPGNDDSGASGSALGSSAGGWLVFAIWSLVAVFVALSLPIGLHPDDVAVMRTLPAASYSEVWTSPFKDLFYRPLTVSLVKVSTDAFGAVAWPLRVLQGGLLVATMALFLRTLRSGTSPAARATGALCLLASPMTFVSMTPFALGVSDTIVALAFIGCVAISAQRPMGGRSMFAAVTLSLVALLAKESGVLVPVYVAAASCLPRPDHPDSRPHWRAALGLLVLVLGYLALRNSLVAGRKVAFATGFMTEMLRPEQLLERFGDSLHQLYGYNVLANLGTALIYVPERGQFRLTALSVVVAIAFTATTLLWLRFVRASSERFRYLPLAAVIPANAALGFMYVRSRVMFVAYVAVALLLTPAIDDLWRRKQRVLGVSGRRVVVATGAAWLVVFVTSLVRLRLQAAR